MNLDTIDSGSITNSKADLHFKNGFVFAKGARIALGFLGLFGLLALISGGNGYIIGPLVLFISTYALTASYGTQISLSNNYIKVYSASFGIKRGKWIPTVLMPDICILKQGKGVVMNQVFGAGSVSLSKAVFEIYILSANHRKRLLLAEVDSGNKAYKQAKELAEKMHKNFVEFNPAISQATRAKRYERH